VFLVTYDKRGVIRSLPQGMSVGRKQKSTHQKAVHLLGRQKRHRGELEWSNVLKWCTLSDSTSSIARRTFTLIIALAYKIVLPYSLHTSYLPYSSGDPSNLQPPNNRSARRHHLPQGNINSPAPSQPHTPTQSRPSPAEGAGANAATPRHPGRWIQGR
jgi:hypothetical protein